MILVPAIDIYDGKCVRLHKGDFNQMTSYPDDPIDVARMFENLGCTHLHVVDLEGARSGEIRQAHVLEKLAKATSLRIDFGGGIKTDKDVHTILEAGADRFTVGSIAVRDENKVFRWLDEFGSERMILGADARDRKIAIDGWTGSAGIDVSTYIEKFAARGITRVICTDINRDGTMEGPSIDLYRELMSTHPGIEIYASGGVRDIGHIAELKKIGMPGVIVGKAIYEGTLNLEKALEIC